MKLNSLLLISLTLLIMKTVFSQVTFEQAKLTPDESRIVFMGNSITEGWPDQHPEFFHNSSYINKGIGGQTTKEMLLRFKQDVVDLKPATVIILAGINDIAQNRGPISNSMIADNIFSMAEIARANHIKVVLCSVLPALDFPWRPGLEPAEKVIDLNNRLKKYALEHKLVYVDYHSAMADENNGLREELTYDGVHPNRSGYLIMEPILENGIHEVFEQE